MAKKAERTKALGTEFRYMTTGDWQMYMLRWELSQDEHWHGLPWLRGYRG